MENKIRVIRVAPGKEAEVVTIKSTLKSYQDEVGGYIECIYPWDDMVAIVCNEEGKLNGLELNRALRDEDGEIYDIIAGTFLIVGLTEDDFCSLTDDDIKKFLPMFKEAQGFANFNGKVTPFTIYS